MGQPGMATAIVAVNGVSLLNRLQCKSCAVVRRQVCLPVTVLAEYDAVTRHRSCITKGMFTARSVSAASWGYTGWLLHAIMPQGKVGRTIADE